MVQVNPWEKAAECERALRLTLDPVHRENLTNIRSFWISLANERRFLSKSEFAKQAEAIGRLHARLVRLSFLKSAFPSKADIRGRNSDVLLVPKASCPFRPVTRLM